MLEQVLAGNPVTLGLAAWTAYGPALAVGLLALVLLALPSLRNRPTTARRPDQVVMRSTDDVGIAAYLPGLILGVIAAALIYYGARPQVVIAADSFTCLPWTRPLQWSEITGTDANATAWGGRPAIEVSITFAGEMRRGGVLTRAEEIAIAALRGQSSLVARERGRGSGTCPLGGLAIDGRDAAGLIEVAFGRFVLGRNLPDIDSPQAVESWCANPPRSFVGRCLELLRRQRDECRNLMQGRSAIVLAGCLYRSAGGERATPPPAQPPRPPATSPPAPPRIAPTPQRPPTPQPPAPQPPASPPPTATPPATTSPATPPTPPTAPGTPPATPTPPSPPSTTPPPTTPPPTTPPSTTPPPAAPGMPPATPPTPPPAGPGKPTTPGAAPPGK